jgi:flagellar biosynthesis protein FlhF
MPATSQIQVLKASYNAFRVIGIDHCIISKMDEAMSLGEVLSMVVTEKLSLAYITDGQRIAADIHRCSARSLVTRLLKMWQDNQTDKHFTGDKAQYGQDLVI